MDVEVAGDSCPGCGGRLEYEGVQVAYVTDRYSTDAQTAGDRVQGADPVSGYGTSMPVSLLR